jgi:outer membrane protein assembly factor BamB
MFRLPFLSVALILVVSPSILAGSEDWPRFRGPNGAGLGASAPLPLEFGPDKNVVWKTALPTGYSSPIIAGDRIFVTAERDKKLVTIALGRADGRVLWEREAPRPRAEALDKRNHPAAPSAASDGRRVFIFFPDFGLLAYDVDGKELWRAPLGPFNNLYGMGASPILVGDLVVLVCDQGVDSFIVAFGQADGRERWRTPRPEAASGHSTPIVWTPPDGRAQIIAPGSFLLTAYDAATGEKIWWVRGLSFEMKSTPVIGDDGVLYINGFGSGLNEPGVNIVVPPAEEVFAARDADKSGGLAGDELPDNRSKNWASIMDLDRSGAVSRNEWEYYRAALASRNGMLAIRLGGKGDVTDANVVWRYHRAVPQLPSPLLYKKVLYMVNDGGIVTSLDPATGAVMNQGRLKGAIDSYYASPVAGDDKVYMASEKGKVAVLRPDGGLEPIVVNDLGEDVYATPAIVDGRIYIRTRSALYCFGSPRR